MAATAELLLAGAVEAAAGLPGPAPEQRAALLRAIAAGTLAPPPPADLRDALLAGLARPMPTRFVQSLRACGALAWLLPEIDRLFGVPQRADHHPEIDSGLHSLMVLAEAAALTPDPVVRLGALVHDVGKGLTAPALWPRHPGHEEAGEPLVAALATRLELPDSAATSICHATRWHGVAHRGAALRPGTMVDLLVDIGAFAQPERLDHLLLVCIADKRGRRGFAGADYPEADHWHRALAAALAVEAPPARLHQARAAAIARALPKGHPEG